jgi:hypothetical protein
MRLPGKIKMQCHSQAVCHGMKYNETALQEKKMQCHSHAVESMVMG